MNRIAPRLQAGPDPDVARWQGPILTVGALRRMIEGMDDHTQVVVADDASWYLNVGEVFAPPLDGFPDDYIGTEWQCLTLFAGTYFDSRQI